MDLTTEMSLTSELPLSTMEMNSTISEIDLLPRITYSSLTELVISCVYLVASLIWICGAHSVIIYCVYRDESLHTAYNFIIATCSTQDITINVVGNVFSLYSIVHGAGPVPRWTCALSMVPGVASFFAMCYIIATMAYERYRYFVHPLNHPTLFRPLHTAVILTFAVGIPYVFAIVTEILIGRLYHESILACHLPGTVVMNYLQLGCFLFPSLFITAYCMIRIWRVAMAHRVAPAPIEPTTASVSQFDKIRVAFKAIALVSGTFWGTYIPGFVTRTALFSSGLTWYDMDTRNYYAAAMGIRYTQLMFIQVSSSANPIIYYNTNKALKMSICKTMGWTFTDPDKEGVQRTNDD